MKDITESKFIWWRNIIFLDLALLRCSVFNKNMVNVLNITREVGKVIECEPDKAS